MKGARNRRGFLTAVGGGVSLLAGCGNALPGRRRSTDGRTESGGNTPADDRGPASDDPTTPGSPRTIVVDSADGSSSGSGTAEDPYGSLERAVNEAEPGDTVRAEPGKYRGPIPVRDGGEPGDPVTITGPADAVLKGNEEHRGQPMLIEASHVHLTGLTIDGLLDPDHPDDPLSYAKSPLVEVTPRPVTDEYLEDLIVAPHGIG